MKLTTRFVTLVACLGFLIANAGHADAKSHAHGKKASGYTQTNLISDIPGLAEVTDPNLLNPWGLAFFPGLSPFWINENNAGLAALYFADAVPFPGLPLVTIPAPAAPTGGAPAGIVANIFVESGAFDPGPSQTPMLSMVSWSSPIPL